MYSASEVAEVAEVAVRERLEGRREKGRGASGGGGDGRIKGHALESHGRQLMLDHLLSRISAIAKDNEVPKKRR